jgi:tRNA(Ile)-lysidine synthase
VNRCVAVAVSGGRDSIALLHATHKAAAALGVEVVALHVHHGLVRDADAWRDHVAALCIRWRLRFDVRRLEGRPGKGDSVEAWARRERYAALAQMAREAGASLVLLAQHRRDQAETFLLQALRGAGAAGLAAMAPEFERDGMQWARPWLDLPREAIETYVRRHRLRFVDDTSNDDPRFARNRLRLMAWPALKSAFPDAEVTLVAAARRARAQSEALAELADSDLASCSDGPVLNIARWQALSVARRGNALREWLRRQTGRGAADSLIDRLSTELAMHDRPARWPAGEGIELRRYRGELRVGTRAEAALPSTPVALSIARAGLYRAPAWHGTLRVTRVQRGGVALEHLSHCELRPRLGAEQFQAAPNRPPRSLKKQFQGAGIAPHERNAPLVYAGNRLVFVPGLGIDARMRAAKGEPQVTLEWVAA